jgi:hypothetical protein
MVSNIFVWTEVFNCGEIGAVAIKSFLYHHPHTKVHVYGGPDDLYKIPDDPNVIKVTLLSGLKIDIASWFWRKFSLGVPLVTREYIKKGFKRGHLGTARLWAYLILSRSESRMIHFDSDIVFLGNIISDIADKLNSFDLVGPVRNYKNNPQNLEQFKHLSDVTQTCCFGFNKSKLNEHSYQELVRMCLGSYNPKGHSVIDFFDPVMFEILGNGGGIDFLNHNEVGGCNIFGSRQNKYASINDYDTPFKIDFGERLIHFSAVGSGNNIYRNQVVSVPESYRKYALDRYALFVRIFYGRDIGIDLSAYAPLINSLKDVNIDSWNYSSRRSDIN